MNPLKLRNSAFFRSKCLIDCAEKIQEDCNLCFFEFEKNIEIPQISHII